MRLRSVLAGVVAVAAGVAAAARRGGGHRIDLPVDASPSVAQTLRGVSRRGAPDGRGDGGSVRLDLDRARANHVEPVVEFLTFVQQQRGDSSHLLFVRYDDLDALAAAQGQQVDQFLAQLDQLGVVVSTN